MLSYPGGQKKRFSDNMKLILKCCHIPAEQLEAVASDRQIWRDTCDFGLATFLAEYESVAENRRVRRHQPDHCHIFRLPLPGLRQDLCVGYRSAQHRQ